MSPHVAMVLLFNLGKWDSNDSMTFHLQPYLLPSDGEAEPTHQNHE